MADAQGMASTGGEQTSVCALIVRLPKDPSYEEHFAKKTKGIIRGD